MTNVFVNHFLGIGGVSSVRKVLEGGCGKIRWCQWHDIPSAIDQHWDYPFRHERSKIRAPCVQSRCLAIPTMALDPEKPLLLLDGGLGTTLEDNFGVKFSHQTPLWSGHLLISDPPTLLGAQTAFAAAGSDVILTATYQASFAGFARTPRIDDNSHGGNNGIGYARDEAAEYMNSAIEIARSAFIQAGKRNGGLLALSLGAYGATMSPSTEYSGAYDPEMSDWQGLYKFHYERIMTFVHDKLDWSRISFVAFETLPVVREVRAVRETMKTLGDPSGLRPRYWVSCVFPNQDLKLPDGTTVEELVKELLSPGLPLPYAIGINCTKLSLMRPLIRKFEDAVASISPDYTPRLVIYPDGANNFVYDTTLQQWLPKDNEGGSLDKPGSGSELQSAKTGNKPWGEEMYELVTEVQERGAWPGLLVGGCCKAGPDDIALLRRKLDEAAGASR
ncbi:Homocysteine S-methyltransferase [Xylona heveae TC161]|uniref:Homocysteine S-methyltransferase n=1 Tax=Xylona heveae (strain CBS 132557 / TC161) TaxID=1328760 RepID=A0A164ZU07_XYLHT|nr:Homocysteine S-methyltransferase [Xylona heveae TC161]KZF19515.1 Homocysteine S-methyltransferase [Xylona heveae TC161]